MYVVLKAVNDIEQRAKFADPPSGSLIYRRQTSQKNDYSDNLMVIFKVLAIQEGIQREEERCQRDEDRQLQRERRDAKTNRHKRSMEVRMMVFS